MCGLCLPYCPTYAVGREEGESPRGRIALIKGLAEAKLPTTPKLVEHLESCLACRRCEAVCPAHVRYGELIADARALPALSRRRPRWQYSLGRWLVRPHLRRLLLTFKPALGLLRFWSQRRRSEWAKRISLVDELPSPRTAARRALAAETAAASMPLTGSNDVVLFQGCIGVPHEASLRAGALQLFAALGIRASSADASLCCGTLARYSGDEAGATALERRLIETLRPEEGGVIVGMATGCQKQLTETLRPAGHRVEELQVVIARHPGLSSLRFAPLTARVAVHHPCSQRLLGLESAAAVDQLLDRIPGLSRIELPEQDRCCGAAGSHFLARPTQSERLREQVMADIDEAAPDIIVSANIGCRLFIGGALDRVLRRRIPVLHPVELLAQQLIA